MTTITVEFGHSTSPNYPAAVKIARKTRSYRAEGEGKAVVHVCTFTFEDFRQMELLLEIVRGWRSTRIFVKDKPFLRRDLWQLRAIQECWREAYRLPNPESYCRPRPWAHEWTDEVKRALTTCRKAQVLSHDLNWFDYGYLDTQGRYVIEKDHLLALAENAVSRSRTDLCPLFNWQRMAEAIKGLPDALDPAVVEQMKRRAKEFVFGFTADVTEEEPTEPAGENVLPFTKKRRE